VCVGISDIPDWCTIEALGLGTYDFNTFNTVPPETLKIMFEKSPIAHVDKVSVIFFKIVFNSILFILFSYAANGKIYIISKLPLPKLFLSYFLKSTFHHT
jgi:hypothetical protein